MRAIVHIGMPKSGTTSIQRFLQGQAAGLAARGAAYARVPNGGPVPPQDAHVELGIVQFARAGKPVPDAGTRLSYAIDDPEAHRAFAERYAEALDAALAARAEKTWIFSVEHVGAWTHTADEARALDSWLSERFGEVRYVLYLRRQEDWILSNYSQALRMGSTSELEDYAAKLRISNYDARVFAWAEAVGDRFDLRLLEPDALVDGDLIADFAAAAGVDAAGLPRPGRANESFSVAAAAFLRQLNGTIPQRVKEGRVRNPLMRGIQQRLTRWYAGDRKLALSEAEIARIRAANAAANEAIRTRFFPGRAELFPPRPPAEPQPAPTPEEMGRIGIDLVLALRTHRMQCMSKPEMETLRAEGVLETLPQ